MVNVTKNTPGWTTSTSSIVSYGTPSIRLLINIAAEIWIILRHCPRYQTGIFFSSVWPTVRTYPVKAVTENGSFEKRSPEWRFLKKPAFRIRIDGRKRRFFENHDVIHNILLAWRILRKGCYRIYLVLTFSCGGGKTIRIRYGVFRMRIFFTTEKKNLRFQKYSDRCGQDLSITWHKGSHA